MMTFSQIARVEKLSVQDTQNIYRRAMEKIRQHPEILSKMQSLATGLHRPATTND